MITMLMSVYSRENPDFLRAALQSLVQQTNQPNEVLLVKDGVIGDALDAVVAEYQDRINLRTILLPESRGLAQALNAGLADARHPWIMRFDSDDICEHDRVERQRRIIETDVYDIFGSQISEFEDNPNLVIRHRSVPTGAEEILRFARKRNPFNHMTVCYRKDLALRCGGYPDIAFMEDYALWIKMLVAGARCANDPDPLVRARIGNGMMHRRKGLRYARSEFQLQALMVRTGFKFFHLAVLDAIIRSFMRLVPSRLRAHIYDTYLRQSTNIN